MPILFDSSVYIRAFRPHGDPALTAKRWDRAGAIWLSSVVLEELIAGADSKGLRVLERLERDFEKARRVLTPSHSDWATAGGVLSQLARRYGYEQIGKARLTNDALIAASAARTGVVVVTSNVRDFARLGEFCPLQWKIEPSS